MLCLLSLAFPALTDDTVSNSAQLRAAYLYQFTKFVQWPTQPDRIRIGVFGEDPIINPLMLLDGRLAKGKRIEIKKVSSLRAVRDCCDLIYISMSENKRMPLLLRALGSRPILTVNDSGSFLASGGMISFVRKGDKLRFRINKRKVEKCGLKISADLLKVSLLF